MIISKDDFIKKYKKTPEKIQEWMGNDTVTKTIGNFGETFTLTKEQRRTVADAVGAVLIGFLHPKDFVPSLEKELGVSNEIAKKIAQEVNKKIFSEVKDELIVLHNLDGKHPDKIPVPAPTKISETKTTYNTPPDLFEKKLQNSTLTKKETVLPETKVVEKKPPANTSDSYRESVD